MEEQTKRTEMPEQTATVDADLLLRTALDVAVNTLRAGGEIHRVEETVMRICFANGASHVEVFAISSFVTASVRMTDGSFVSQSRRVLSMDTDFTKLAGMNDISRALTDGRMTLTEAQREVARIKRRRPYPGWLAYIGAFFCAGGFAIMFGGSRLDALAAALIGLAMFAVSRILPPTTNPFAVMVLASFLGGVLTSFSISLGLGTSRGYIFIGMIMPLVPGLAFGNALRDLLSGDTLTGMLGLIRAILLAASIAFGLFISLIVM